MLAAACSIAAVFAVHRIESRGGPIAEPSVSTYFSPNGDGVQDVAEVRFTTQQPERITVRVLDADGATVRTLLEDRRIDGAHITRWDGTDDDGERVADGAYRVHITRAGDSRVYAPTKPIVVDTAVPVGRLDRASLVDGELRGLALLEPGVTIEVVAPDGVTIDENLRVFAAAPGSAGARPSGAVPPGTSSFRFVVPIPARVGAGDLDIVAVDLAGNRLNLRAAVDAPRIEVAS